MMAVLNRNSVIHAIQEFAAMWNQGDIEAACQVYAGDASFLSVKGLKRGRQQILADYRSNYPNKASMGILIVSLLEVRLSTDMATAIVRWKLQREDKESEEGYGLEVFKVVEGNVCIVQDASF